MIQIKSINGSRYCEVATGRIMSPDTALVAWCECWKKERANYLGLHRYGEEEKQSQEAIKAERISQAMQRIKSGEGDLRIGEIAYRGSCLDGSTWEYMDEDGVVRGSWLENRQECARKILSMKFRRSKSSISFDVPKYLKPNEKKICDAILNKERVNLKSGLVRYGNGVAMDTKAIAELAGISNTKTAQRALKGLIDKEVLKRETVKNTSVYYVNKQRYSIDNTKSIDKDRKEPNCTQHARHQLFKVHADSWADFYDHHSISQDKIANESKYGWWDYLQ